MENGTQTAKHGKARRVIRASAAVLLLAALLCAAGWFLQPVWKVWNNYDTSRGFYQQPKNTIETIFVGSSVVVSGIAPTLIYDEYGLCTYNLSSEQQPMLASYYWTKEVYRLHAGSLKTVVLDVSMFRRNPNASFYRKALDGMHLGRNKYEAVRATTGSFNEALSYLIPLFSYHSRWNSLTQTDIDKFSYAVNRWTRGYEFSLDRYVWTDSYDQLPIPYYYENESAEDTLMSGDALYYLKSLIDFCEEKGLRLLLIKTPVVKGWAPADHNAAQFVADEAGLTFLDFNFVPLIDEIGFNAALDTMDGGHLNYYGAARLSSWLGAYLAQECGGTDVRGDSRFAFLEDESRQFSAFVAGKREMSQATTLAEYVRIAAGHPDYVTFLTVKDDAASGMTDDLRADLAALGLTELSQLEYRDSYYAVVYGDGTVTERRDRLTDHPEIDGLPLEEVRARNSLEGRRPNEPMPAQPGAITAEGMLPGSIPYRIASGGLKMGNTSSCSVYNEEFSMNLRGVNCVVYDLTAREPVDITVFDTNRQSARNEEDMGAQLERLIAGGATAGDVPEYLRNLYDYIVRCRLSRQRTAVNRTVGDDGLLAYLEMFAAMPHTRIFLAVKDEAALSLSDEARQWLADLGLEKLAEVEYRDSYAAVITDGAVEREGRSHGRTPLVLTGNGYRVVSGGFDSGSCASVTVFEEETGFTHRGVCVLVYDTEINRVIDYRTFDSSRIPMAVPGQTGGEEP